MIEYEVTMTVRVPEDQPDDEPRPFEQGFYERHGIDCDVTRARRITPATSYGGPR